MTQQKEDNNVARSTATSSVLIGTAIFSLILLGLAIWGIVKVWGCNAGYAIAALVLLIFVPPVGLIMGIIGIFVTPGSSLCIPKASKYSSNYSTIEMQTS
jgi:ABC-type polysaccharide/polyol phosphate export permease